MRDRIDNSVGITAAWPASRRFCTFLGLGVWISTRFTIYTLFNDWTKHARQATHDYNIPHGSYGQLQNTSLRSMPSDHPTATTHPQAQCQRRSEDNHINQQALRSYSSHPPPLHIRPTHQPHPVPLQPPAHPTKKLTKIITTGIIATSPNPQTKTKQMVRNEPL